MERIIISILLILFSFQSQGQIAMWHAHNQQREYEFLLDEYPNAALAYSFWKLKSDYAGPCVRVYTSASVFQDFYFINNYVDTAGIKTFVGAVSIGQMIFYDQSGNARHSSFATFNSALRIINAGTLPIRNTSGLWAASFGDEINAYHVLLPTGFLNGATTISYFQTALIDDVPNSNGGVFGPSTTFGTGLEVVQLSTVNRRSALRINNVIRNDNAGVAYQLWNDSIQSVTSIFGNSTSVSAFKNGSTVTLTNSAAMPALNFNGVYALGLYSSVATDASGSINELVIYTTDQTSNRTGIEANINNRYSIY